MKHSQRLPVIILWAARIWGTAVLAFILFFLFAHLFGESEPGEGFRSVKAGLFIVRPDLIMSNITLAIVPPGILYLVYSFLAKS